MANGTSWSFDNLPIRPGIYTNFEEVANNNVTSTARGIVAIPFATLAGTAVAGTVYVVERNEATGLAERFGAEAARIITLAINYGASSVKVFAPVETEVGPAFESITNTFEAEDFHIIAFPAPLASEQQLALKAWVDRNRDEGKYFSAVVGGAVDETQTDSNARANLLSDRYIFNVGNGLQTVAGATLSGAESAVYVAGKVAGTPLNQSITFDTVPLASDVTVKLRNSEVVSALTGGSIVFIKDGQEVRIEQGVTTASTAVERSKIRAVRVEQAVASDIRETVRRQYIGKINNDQAGQAALISAIRLYLTTLANNGVLLNPQAIIDPRFQSTGDQVFVQVSYNELDSMERIFLTITA